MRSTRRSTELFERLVGSHFLFATYLSESSACGITFRAQSGLFHRHCPTLYSGARGGVGGGHGERKAPLAGSWGASLRGELSGGGHGLRLPSTGDGTKDAVLDLINRPFNCG